MILHQHDCEIYQVADLLKDMLKYEETIDDYDTRKHFGILVDDLIDCIEIINHDIQDARQEVYMYDSRCEELEYQLAEANDTIDELKTKLEAIHQAIESIND